MYLETMERVLGQTSKITEKRELIILLKPTVVDSDKDWSDDIARSRDRMNNLSEAVREAVQERAQASFQELDDEVDRERAR